MIGCGYGQNPANIIHRIADFRASNINTHYYGAPLNGISSGKINNNFTINSYINYCVSRVLSETLPELRNYQKFLLKLQRVAEPDYLSLKEIRRRKTQNVALKEQIYNTYHEYNHKIKHRFYMFSLRRVYSSKYIKNIQLGISQTKKQRQNFYNNLIKKKKVNNYLHNKVIPEINSLVKRRNQEIITLADQLLLNKTSVKYKNK